MRRAVLQGRTVQLCITVWTLVVAVILPLRVGNWRSSSPVCKHSRHDVQLVDGGNLVRAGVQLGAVPGSVQQAGCNGLPKADWVLLALRQCLGSADLGIRWGCVDTCV